MISKTLTLIPILFAAQAAAHMSLWTPAMYGFNDDYTPVTPLHMQSFNEWWFHGFINSPPSTSDALPAGGQYHAEVGCTKEATSLGGGHGDLGCEMDLPSLHLTNNDPSDIKGCAIAIAYKSDVHSIQPEDFTVISINAQCPYKREVSFDIPAGLPACPEGGCHCAWGWVHSSGGGGDENYFTGFKCHVTGAKPDAKPVPMGSPPKRCSEGGCVKGPKQMLYWNQAEGNNMPNGNDDPPFYNEEYGFSDGAQNDIWDGGNAAFTPTGNKPNVAVGGSNGGGSKGGSNNGGSNNGGSNNGGSNNGGSNNGGSNNGGSNNGGSNDGGSNDGGSNDGGSNGGGYNGGGGSNSNGGYNGGGSNGDGGSNNNGGSNSWGNSDVGNWASTDNGNTGSDNTGGSGGGNSDNGSWGNSDNGNWGNSDKGNWGQHHGGHGGHGHHKTYGSDEPSSSATESPSPTEAPSTSDSSSVSSSASNSTSTYESTSTSEWNTDGGDWSSPSPTDDGYTPSSTSSSSESEQTDSKTDEAPSNTASEGSEPSDSQKEEKPSSTSSDESAPTGFNNLIGEGDDPVHVKIPVTSESAEPAAKTHCAKRAAGRRQLSRSRARLVRRRRVSV